MIFSGCKVSFKFAFVGQLPYTFDAVTAASEIDLHTSATGTGTESDFPIHSRRSVLPSGEWNVIPQPEEASDSDNESKKRKNRRIEYPPTLSMKEFQQWQDDQEPIFDDSEDEEQTLPGDRNAEREAEITYAAKNGFHGTMIDSNGYLTQEYVEFVSQSVLDTFERTLLSLAGSPKVLYRKKLRATRCRKCVRCHCGKCSNCVSTSSSFIPLLLLCFFFSICLVRCY